MNVETLYDEVLSVDHEPNNVKVKTKNHSFTASKVFNSIPNFTPYKKEFRLKNVIATF